MLRPLVSLFAATSLLHLTMVGSDLACSTHEVHEAVAEQAAPTSHQHGVSTSSEKEDPCKTPGLPACCQLVTSCSISLASATEVDVDGADLNAARTFGVLSDIPKSRASGPEPPPPKA